VSRAHEVDAGEHGGVKDLILPRRLWIGSNAGFNTMNSVLNLNISIYFTEVTAL
jgi:hypothetical protein